MLPKVLQDCIPPADEDRLKTLPILPEMHPDSLNRLQDSGWKPTQRQWHLHESAGRWSAWMLSVLPQVLVWGFGAEHEG